MSLKVSYFMVLSLSFSYFSCKNIPEQSHFNSSSIQKNVTPGREGISEKEFIEKYPDDDPCNEYKLVQSTVSKSFEVFLININREIGKGTLDSTYYKYIPSEERYLISVQISLDGEFELIKLTDLDISLTDNKFYYPEGELCLFLLVISNPVEDFFADKTLTGKNFIKSFSLFKGPKRSNSSNIYHKKKGKEQKPKNTPSKTNPPQRKQNGTRNYY